VQRIDYGNMMHRAMRGLIAEVLTGVAETGLPGAHHFFITFDTTHPEVELSDWLHTRYPEEMTIVLQNWFEELEVGEDQFSVTLNFGDQPERLVVPFDSIRTFVDPSVEFGLRFEQSEAEGDGDEDDLPPEDEPPASGPETPPSGRKPSAPVHKDAEVVSLDKFRK